MKDIVIFGTGGHAKVVCDIIIKQKLYNLKAFVSLNADLTSFCGLPHYDQKKLAQLEFNHGIVAIGDNFIRHQVVDLILKTKPGFNFVSAIHPSAQIGMNSSIDQGTVVMANAVINPDSKIGQHVIINTGANIDHDNFIANYASVAPGCVLGGNVKVGGFTAVSIGSCVKHGITIGEHSVIGAGSVVVKNIESNKVAYGSPCVVIRDRAQGEKYL